MDDKSNYILNDYKQNYPFCILKLLELSEFNKSIQVFELTKKGKGVKNWIPV